MTWLRWIVSGLALCFLVGASAATSPATISQSAYVVSCVPELPLGDTLYPLGTNFYPHHYDGTKAGAKAFVHSHPGRCWQTGYP